MAHGITATDTVIYTGEKPWHGLGKDIVGDPRLVAEVLAQAGLDWTVATEPLYLANGTKSPGFGVVRSSDGKVLGVVRKRYAAVNNQNIFAPVQAYLDSGTMSVETAGSLFGGARVWMLLKVKGAEESIVPQSDDRVQLYWLAAGGHDGMFAIFQGPTATRVVCNNTVSMATNMTRREKDLGVSDTGMMRIRHTGGAQAQLDEVENLIGKTKADFSAAAKFFRELAGKPVRSAAQLRRYIDAVFPAAPKPAEEKSALAGLDPFELLAQARSEKETEQLRDDLLSASQERKDEEQRRIYSEIEQLFEAGRGNDLPGVKGTAWGAYNAATEYLTWERGRQDSRLANAWFSNGAKSANTVAVQAAADVFLS